MSSEVQKSEIGKNFQNDKELPQNIEAEQNVLGSILYDNESFDKISESIKENHFYDPLHKKIFSSCSKLINRGQLASPITLKAFFSEDEINFSEIESNRNYLQNLIDGVGNFSAIKDYALEIKECFFRRELIRIGSEMIKDASDLKIEDISEKQIEQAESKLYGLAEIGLLEQGPKNFDIVLTDTIKKIDTTLKHDGNLSGLDTGLIDLNSKLG